MNLGELTDQAVAVRKKYDELNKQQGTAEWQIADYMAGFVGDVGDLSKLIMAYRGLRSGANVEDKLAHELADCLWSLLILADRLDINLSDAFTKTMTELHARLDASLKS